MPTNWNIKFDMDADTLRRLNPVPVILQMNTEIQGLEKSRADIFLVLTEMYSNALEHGLLKLDSEIKNEENGFSKYYEQRQSSLNKLTDAKMTININHSEEDKKGVIVMSVEHDGEGFDYTNINGGLDKNKNQYGRGIALLSNMCKKFNYSNEGRQLQVEYEWEYSDEKQSV